MALLTRYYDFYRSVQRRFDGPYTAVWRLPVAAFFIAIPALASELVRLPLSLFDAAPEDRYILALVFVGINALYFLVCSLYRSLAGRHRRG